MPSTSSEFLQHVVQASVYVLYSWLSKEMLINIRSLLQVFESDSMPQWHCQLYRHISLTDIEYSENWSCLDSSQSTQITPITCYTWTFFIFFHTIILLGRNQQCNYHSSIINLKPCNSIFLKHFRYSQPFSAHSTTASLIHLAVWKHRIIGVKKWGLDQVGQADEIFILKFAWQYVI